MVIKRTSVHSGVVLESVPLLMCSLSPLRKLPFVLRDQYVTKPACLLMQPGVFHSAEIRVSGSNSDSYSRFLLWTGAASCSRVANAVSFSFRFSSHVSYWLEINIKILSCSPDICRFWAKHAKPPAWCFKVASSTTGDPKNQLPGLIRCFIFSSALMKLHHLWQRASLALTCRASWSSLSRLLEEMWWRRSTTDTLPPSVLKPLYRCGRRRRNKSS